MNWTKERPIQHGFYWIRSLLEEAQPVQIVIDSHFKDPLRVRFIGDDDHYGVKSLHDGYEFYGPIQVPNKLNCFNLKFHNK